MLSHGQLYVKFSVLFRGKGVNIFFSAALMFERYEKVMFSHEWNGFGMLSAISLLYCNLVLHLTS